MVFCSSHLPLGHIYTLSAMTVFVHSRHAHSNALEFCARTPMRESGLFHHLIAEEYPRESLAKIEEILESHRIHEILPIALGLFTACPSQAPDSLTGYQNVWIRDNVMVANSFRLRGQLAPAIACMKGLPLLLETQLPLSRHHRCNGRPEGRRQSTASHSLHRAVTRRASRKMAACTKRCPGPRRGSASFLQTKARCL